MREIKFRAWTGKALLYDGFGIDPEGVPMTPAADHDWKELALMQYAGQKDKNGTEIYEGDIISYFDSHNIFDRDEQITMAVEWNNEEAEWFPLSSLIMRFGEGEEWSLPPDLEIVGNIYQHSELLK